MVKSVRGREVNFQSLRIKNQNTLAVSNKRFNARGDMLDKNGKVIKTREQLSQEYNKKNANAVKKVPISKDVVKTVKAQDEKIAAGNAEHAKSKKKNKIEE